MEDIGDVFQLNSHDGLDSESSAVFFSNATSTSRNSVTSSMSGDGSHYAHLLSNRAGEFQLWRAIREINLTPLVIINTLYMLIGVVGNSTVCYVCAIRMPHTVLNNFVLSLAIAELLGCVLIIPLEITKTMNAYNFDYPKLCKTEQYLRSFMISFTSCVLIAIATERYQRIVKPHNRHVTMTQYRLTITGAVIFAGIAAIPESVLAGSQTLETASGKFVICSTYSSDSFAGTVFPPLWACFVVLVYVISTAAIGSIYCVIAVTIWKRGKLQTDRRSRPNTPDLTLRRRVQCFYPKNHPSVMYLPHHHHHSMTSAPDPEHKDGFSHGSLPGYGLRSPFRHHSDFGLLTAPASPDDELEIRAEVHHSGSPKSPGSTKQTEDQLTPTSPWLPSFTTNTSRFLFETHHFDHGPNQQQDEQHQQQHRRNRDSISSDNSMWNNVVFSRTSGAHDATEDDCEIRHERTSQLSDDVGGHDFQHRNNCGDYHLQQQLDDKKKERRRVTAVFFDELYQTVSRRRQRQEAEYFERHGSTEDILTPPSLTPMGSIRSRSGYSRKRTTFIMFVMTTTTAISLLPHTIVLLYRLAHPTVEVHLSPDSSILFYLAWNSFFISLASHPYVYGFWNGRFKKALISLFDGLREKTKRRRLTKRDEGNKDNNVGKMGQHSECSDVV